MPRTRESPVAPLVGALMERQAQGRMTGGEFARLLGYDESYWSLIKRGRVALTYKIVANTLAAFDNADHTREPELWALALAWIEADIAARRRAHTRRQRARAAQEQAPGPASDKESAA